MNVFEPVVAYDPVLALSEVTDASALVTLMLSELLMLTNEALALVKTDAVDSKLVVRVLNEPLAAVKLFVMLVKLEAVTSKLVTREETEPEVKTKFDAVVSNSTTLGTRFEAVASVLVTLVEKEPEALSKPVNLVLVDPLIGE